MKTNGPSMDARISRHRFVSEIVFFSNDDVDEKVERGVESDEGVRDPVDDVEPVRPDDVEADVVVFADERRVERRDQLPDVAEDEEPDDAERNPGKTKLLLLLPSGRAAARHSRHGQAAVVAMNETRESRRSATSGGPVTTVTVAFEHPPRRPHRVLEVVLVAGGVARETLIVFLADLVVRRDQLLDQVGQFGVILCRGHVVRDGVPARRRGAQQRRFLLRHRVRNATPVERVDDFDVRVDDDDVVRFCHRRRQRLPAADPAADVVVIQPAKKSKQCQTFLVTCHCYYSIKAKQCRSMNIY